MKNYLYLSAAFFSLVIGTYSWCHSENEHEWPIKDKDTARFVAKVYDEQDISADKGAKYKEKKRKIEDDFLKQDDYSTPDLYNNENDEPSTQKESDFEQETILDINERASKIIRLDIHKKSNKITDTTSLDARIKKFRKRTKRSARRHTAQDKLPKSGLSELTNNYSDGVHETF